jgi:hypothetical protein
VTHIPPSQTLQKILNPSLIYDKDICFSTIFCTFAREMIETFLISGLLLIMGMALLLVKVLIRKNGTFSSQHIHDSEAMRERGIHCVLDQDREMRNKGTKHKLET